VHAHSFQPRPSSDPIDHPPHYADTDNGVECIDAIQAALGREGFAAFLRGQIIKYQWRFGKKGDALEDARKAQWYGNKLVALLTKRKDTPW